MSLDIQARHRAVCRQTQANGFELGTCTAPGSGSGESRLDSRFQLTRILLTMDSGCVNSMITDTRAALFFSIHTVSIYKQCVYIHKSSHVLHLHLGIIQYKSDCISPAMILNIDF
ncbi:hypothetical protein JOB18_041227 [Solea senegalensis]|uniref:Uncharacterized protein n=1 Tax=Solea senegalensis TaxID=28829 RepID=A0AAV6RQ83_SOLSE|nr:hypothetical protein JOB18_041227 [Solea senegalensis]